MGLGSLVAPIGLGAGLLALGNFLKGQQQPQTSSFSGGVGKGRKPSGGSGGSGRRRNPDFVGPVDPRSIRTLPRGGGSSGGPREISRTGEVLEDQFNPWASVGDYGTGPATLPFAFGGANDPSGNPYDQSSYGFRLLSGIQGLPGALGEATDPSFFSSLGIDPYSRGGLGKWAEEMLRQEVPLWGNPDDALTAILAKLKGRLGTGEPEDSGGGDPEYNGYRGTGLGHNPGDDIILNALFGPQDPWQNMFNVGLNSGNVSEFVADDDGVSILPQYLNPNFDF